MTIYYKLFLNIQNSYTLLMSSSCIINWISNLLLFKILAQVYLYKKFDNRQIQGIKQKTVFNKYLMCM